MSGGQGTPAALALRTALGVFRARPFPRSSDILGRGGWSW